MSYNEFTTLTLVKKKFDLQGPLPGFISKFNFVTLQTFQDTDNGENVVAGDHAKDLFDKLGI